MIGRADIRGSKSKVAMNACTETSKVCQRKYAACCRGQKGD